MKTYTPTIGLEVHAELKTRTKMFCDSRNDPDSTEPNSNICPVCMAHPGTLPVVNEAAVAHVLRIGHAVGGSCADFSEFDRKNYFYPDIPKGYQISQYKYPLVSGGKLAGVALTRIHLEEDTARSQHDEETNTTLIDFNRAGVPLMELVTEPCIQDAAQAGAFARELQLLLRYLGASEANMEKGEMRVEANVSVSTSETFGTKVEVKNLNSFRSVERAIEYEIQRQTELLESGGQVVQETRGWDEQKNITYAQRLKETSEDYRYFPDPDIPKLIISEIPELSPEVLKAQLPELPWEKRSRYKEEFGLTDDIANALIRAQCAEQKFSEEVEVSGTSDKDVIRSVANYIVSEIPGALQDDGEAFGKMAPASLVAVAEMKKQGEISSRGVKEIIAIMIREGGAPEAIAKREGLLQESDKGELVAAIDVVLKENERVVAEYVAGKEEALKFLVGQGMKATRGAANPQKLAELLKQRIKERHGSL